MLALLVLGSCLFACDGATTRAGGQPGSARTYEQWRDGPTRGDLAGDRAVRDAAVAAWQARAGLTDAGSQTKHLLDHPTSEARVVWAGKVSGIAAAVVFQRVDITPEELPGLDEGVPPGSEVWGFLRVQPDGRARIGSVTSLIGGDVPFNGVLGGWLDGARGVGLLLDLGVPLVSSDQVDVLPDGNYGRLTHPVIFTRPGISVIDVGRSTALTGVEFGPRDPQLGERYALPGTRLRRSVRHLDWSVPHGPSTAPVVPIVGLASAGSALEVTLKAGGMISAKIGDDSGPSYGTGPWAVAGRLPDGTSLIVSALDVGGTARKALLLGTTYADAGRLDVQAALPVAVRLPDGRGWVVASPRATLRYRVPGGGWQVAGFEAALLPDANHVDVEVTRPSDREVVPLG